MKRQLSPQEWQALSAYLDGQLSTKETARMEARLKGNPELQTALHELRQTRSVLRRAARRRAPHNFTLTPDMVGQVIKSRTSPLLVRGMSLASALSAFLLILTLAGQFLLRGGLGASAPMLTAQQLDANKTFAPAAESAFEATPMLITWGTPTPEGYDGTPVMGMGGGGPVDELSAPSGMGGAPDTYPPSIKGGEPAPDARIMEPSPTEEPTLAPEPTSAPAALPTLEAADTANQVEEGPILGVQPAGNQAAITEGTREVRTPSSLSFFMVAAIALAVLALGTGLAAVFLRRRS